MNVAPGLTDEFLESYVCWREECAGVQLAYDEWQRARDAAAFARYQAALDREEHAAWLYRERTERISAEVSAARERVIQAMTSMT